eukprot:SAG31_NODE_8580_length_1426_cov_8.814619_1_plen_56_part_00
MTAVSRELTFDDEKSKSVDVAKLVQLLRANTDKDLIQTEILDVFKHGSELLAPDF